MNYYSRLGSLRLFNIHLDITTGVYVLFVPVVVVRGEHHTGTGVGVAGHPGAVDGEHHQQHQHEHGDNGLDVWAQTLLCLLLLGHMFAHLTSLQGETNTIMRDRKHLQQSREMNY